MLEPVNPNAKQETQAIVKALDFTKEYKKAKTVKEREAIVKAMQEELNLVTQREAQIKQSFENLSIHVNQMKEQYEQTKAFYIRQINYVKTQVNAFFDAVSQVTGGIE